MSFSTTVGIILKGFSVAGLREPFSKMGTHRSTLPNHDLPLALGVALMQVGDVFTAANRVKPLLLRPAAVNLFSVIPYALASYVLKSAIGSNHKTKNKNLERFCHTCFEVTSTISCISTVITGVALVALGNYTLGITTLGLMALNCSGIENEDYKFMIKTTSLVSLLYFQPLNALLYLGYIQILIPMTLRYGTLVSKYNIMKGT